MEWLKANTMWPRDNPSSWQVVGELIEEQPDDAYWLAYKRAIRGILSALTERGLDQELRAGQSMHVIMLSTLDHHGLRGEPHVALTIEPNDGTVRVAYSYGNPNFDPPVAEQVCPIHDATPTVIAYLQRLWLETKANVPMPAGLTFL